MAYSAGDPILDDEYNIFVASTSDPFGYNHFAGTGATTFGLNQASIATVSAGDAVAASSWNALFTGMDNIANHSNSISNSIIGLVLVTPLRSDRHWWRTWPAWRRPSRQVESSATALSADRASGSSSTNSVQHGTCTSTIERSVTFANSATL